MGRDPRENMTKNISGLCVFRQKRTIGSQRETPIFVHTISNAPMTDNTNLSMDPADEIHADNELLKLKLELDHGMVMSETSQLPPEIENQWLRNIHDFERLSKEAEKIKVFDFIKRPVVAGIDSMKSDEIPAALHELKALMFARGVSLDCCREYDPAVIYRFITEELFEKEMDNIALEGMVYYFIYEEFHPNHDYELRRKSTDFVNRLLERKWNEFDACHFAHAIYFGDIGHSAEEMGDIIKTFQEAYSSFELIRFEIGEVTFDLVTKRGSLKGILVYEAHIAKDGLVAFNGECVFHFAYGMDVWGISHFKLPGFG